MGFLLSERYSDMTEIIRILFGDKAMLLQDKDLPWAMRILRWVLVGCVAVYAVNFVLLSIRSGWF